MKVLKRSARRAPKLSFVLLDWSVRESFHFLHYLSEQNVPRDEFEVVIIEYYDRQSEALAPFQDQVDTWALLEMPRECYYHKHLMYNAGIVLAGGDVIVICDSDAMARPTLVQTIVGGFEETPSLVLHLDQFRNMRRDFYPFNYPSFDDVIGPGCINNVDGRTKGVASVEDPLHERNYGACMCARREDLITIGGADEHVDYLGHICGPYDMTFRLVNIGRREIWHDSEFLYHTWHPGQAGVDNYLGPHDGRHMSTTSLEALATRRVQPYVINPAIERLRREPATDPAVLESLILEPSRIRVWERAIQSPESVVDIANATRSVFDYRGFRVRFDGHEYLGQLIVDDALALGAPALVLRSDTDEGVRRQIDHATGGVARMASLGGSASVLAVRLARASGVMARRAIGRVSGWPGRLWRGAVQFAKRSVDRARRFFMERRHLSGALTSIIVNLYFLRRRAALLGGRAVTLIVDSRAAAYYVQALTKTGVLPAVNVVHLRAEQVPGWLHAFAGSGSSAILFTGRDFYAKHYADFADAGVVTRTTVL